MYFHQSFIWMFSTLLMLQKKKFNTLLNHLYAGSLKKIIDKIDHQIYNSTSFGMRTIKINLIHEVLIGLLVVLVHGVMFVRLHLSIHL